MNENTKQKNMIFAYIVMGIYLLFLSWLILFKLADSIDKIPFHYDQLSGSRFHVNEVFYNALVFIPAGFYFSAFSKRSVVWGIVSCAMLSLGFEITQWIFALGASDITDLITNTSGGFLGLGLFFITHKLFKGNEILIVSIIGAVIEVLLLGLLIILFFFSR